MGDGWQAKGCCSPIPAPSLSLPPDPPPPRAGLAEEMDAATGMEEEAELERTGCPATLGLRDWEEVIRTRVEVGLRSTPLVAAPLMGTGAWRHGGPR